MANSSWANNSCTELEAWDFNTWQKTKDGTLSYKTDLDGDKTNEDILLEKSIGSGYSDNYLTVVSSKNSQTIRIENHGSFYQFLNITEIPEILLTAENRKLRFGIERILFRVICQSLDPSAQRLLNPKQKLTWHSGLPRMPSSYTVIIKREDAKALFKEYEIKTNSAWLSYFGHNHRRAKNAKLELSDFILFDKNEKFKLLATAHGIVLYNINKNQYAWYYVFQGGHKLRWASVLNASFGKNDKIDIQLRQ